MKTFRFAALTALLVAATPALAQSLEDRVARIERMLNSSALVDMATQQQQLRSSLQELQGEVELLRRDVDEIKERQRELFADIDRRLRDLETAQPVAPGPAIQAPAQQPAAPGPVQPQQVPAAPADGQQQQQPPAATATPAPSASVTGDELADYQAAFALLKAGSYDKARSAFSAHVEHYPKGRYTDNALYWLGESHYVVRDFDNALTYFQRIMSDYPTSPKRSDALLKIGFVQQEKGQVEQARTTLQQVVSQFPGTTAAALAEQRLNRLR